MFDKSCAYYLLSKHILLISYVINRSTSYAYNAIAKNIFDDVLFMESFLIHSNYIMLLHHVTIQ